MKVEKPIQQGASNGTVHASMAEALGDQLRGIIAENLETQGDLLAAVRRHAQGDGKVSQQDEAQIERLTSSIARLAQAYRMLVGEHDDVEQWILKIGWTL